MAIKTFDGSSGSGYSPPAQTNNAGKVLTTNGLTTTWQTPVLNLIGTVTAESGTNMSFSNIPQTYRHLKLIASGIAGSGFTYIRFNTGDLTFSGNYHQYSSASAVTGSGGSYLPLGNFQTGWGFSCDVSIPNYSSAILRKTAHAQMGGSGGNVGYATSGGSSQMTTAINKIEIITASGYSNFTAYLYGWN